MWHDVFQAGYVLGGIAYVCYFIGRIPQAIENHRRKSMEGLSMAMFIILILAKLTYQASVCLLHYLV
jgi:uncharacterized protein with PQ loop repeat